LVLRLMHSVTGPCPTENLYYIWFGPDSIRRVQGWGGEDKAKARLCAAAPTRASLDGP
jgi:hypothetical protein